MRTGECCWHPVVMAGTLHALLTTPSDVVHAQATQVGAALVPLAPRTGLVLLPLTEDVHDRIAGATRRDPPVLGFYELSSGLAQWARMLSVQGPVAYVHAEFFAGTGFHAAVVWRDAAICFGPLFTMNAAGEAEDHYTLVPPERGGDMAINRVLRWLGVHVGEGWDEFDAAGLSRHRRTEQWPETNP